MPVRLLSPTDPGVAAAWEVLCGASAQATGFASMAVGEAMAAAFGLRLRVAAVDGPSGFAAGSLVYERRRGPLRCAVVPALAFYHGPLLAAPLHPGHVAERRTPLDALAAFVQDRYDAVAFHLHPSLTDVRAFAWAGFETRVLYTYRTAPPAPPALRKDVQKTRRRHVLRLSSPSSDDPNALALLLRRYTRDGKRPAMTAPALGTLLRRLTDVGLARVLRGDAEAAPSAGSDAARASTSVQVLLHGPAETHAWMAGSTPGAAMTLLQAGLLDDAHAAGTLFDLGGANTPSIAAYKHGFGLPLVPYVRATWHRPGLARMVAAIRPLV